MSELTVYINQPQAVEVRVVSNDVSVDPIQVLPPVEVGGANVELTMYAPPQIEVVVTGAMGQTGADGVDGEGAVVPSDSTITYDGDNISRIDYADGTSKVLTYNLDGTVHTIVWDRITEVITKTMSYSGGVLIGVDVETN